MRYCLFAAYLLFTLSAKQSRLILNNLIVCWQAILCASLHKKVCLLEVWPLAYIGSYIVNIGRKLNEKLFYSNRL